MPAYSIILITKALCLDNHLTALSEMLNVWTLQSCFKLLRRRRNAIFVFIVSLFDWAFCLVRFLSSTFFPYKTVTPSSRPYVCLNVWVMAVKSPEASLCLFLLSLRLQFSPVKPQSPKSLSDVRFFSQRMSHVPEKKQGREALWEWV